MGIAACGGSKELAEEIPLTPEELMQQSFDSLLSVKEDFASRARAAEENLRKAESSKRFQEAFLESFNGSADKIGQLAEALKENADWRPEEGVRSVKETLAHVASANYFLSTKLGADFPEGLDLENLEKEESINEIIDVLRKSFSNVRIAAGTLQTKALDEEVVLVGETKGPRSKALMILLDHMNEHQGQLIAYARVNGVIPPWSNAP